MQAECLFMMGSLEKSLRYWHKAAKLRPNQEEVFTVTFSTLDGSEFGVF
jgi:hypothetical protein